jgi:hypothetical protein
MRNRRRTWLLRRLVLGMAIVAVAAPVAQARSDEGSLQSDRFVQGVTDFPSTSGADIWQVTGVVVHGDDKIGLVPSTSVRLVGHPDNRADRSGPGFDGAAGDVTLVGHPDNRAERYGPGFEATVGAEYGQYAYRGMLPSDYGQPNAIVAVDRTGDGFDWGDAGIGAGTLFGIVLLAAGALVATRHLSRPATA